MIFVHSLILFFHTQDDDIRNLFFGDFIDPDAHPKVYDEINDFTQLSTVMEHYLDEYNQVNSVFKKSYA